MSRGLGDFAYKADGRLAPGDQKVSCAPEFYGAELRAGDLLILACDGVFDVTVSYTHLTLPTSDLV